MFGCTRDLSTLHARNNVIYGAMDAAPNGTFTHADNLYYMTDGASVGYSLGSGERIGDPRSVDLGRKVLLRAGVGGGATADLGAFATTPQPHPGVRPRSRGAEAHPRATPATPSA